MKSPKNVFSEARIRCCMNILLRTHGDRLGERGSVLFCLHTENTIKGDYQGQYGDTLILVIAVCLCLLLHF